MTTRTECRSAGATIEKRLRAGEVYEAGGEAVGLGRVWDATLQTRTELDGKRRNATEEIRVENCERNHPRARTTRVFVNGKYRVRVPSTPLCFTMWNRPVGSNPAGRFHLGFRWDLTQRYR